MARLQESQNRFSITLPASVVRLLGWRKGDNIELGTDLKGRLYLSKSEAAAAPRP